MPAFEDPAVHHDPAADPRPERELDEAPRVATAAGPEFSVGRGVAVVLKDRRLAEPAAEQVSDR